MQEIMQFVGRHPTEYRLDRVTGGGSCDYV